MPPTHALAQLIDSVKAANNWSDPDLVENARRRGHELTKSNISRYRIENPLVSIKGSVIQALADALGVSAGQVATAAVQSMGIALPVYDTPRIEQAIRADPELSIRDKDILLSMLGQMREPITKGRLDAIPTDSPPPTRASREALEEQKTDVVYVPNHLPELKVSKVVETETDVDEDEPHELPAAARRGGGKSEGRRRREEQDRQAEME